jgi:uncharacterized protein
MPNHLQYEQSTYLLQHANNPVNWYPWGEEAFALAKIANKPVIVSIGYAACHWCHVMERESFEDDTTAAYMNEHFINIKVDREEYPDVDDFYMTAVQAITGSGGWPLNVFVSFDKAPFYGGTYFPPIAAHGRLSWLQLLARMNDVWQHRPEEVRQQATQMITYLKTAAQLSSVSTDEQWTVEYALQSAKNMLLQADRVNGGFGRAPKFPSTMAIKFLLEHAHYTGSLDALKHAILSLDAIIEGGIYDQIGGGFARYSVDDKWLVPHFEKMLYDNAMLLSTLCDAYMITKRLRYKEVAAETIEFLLREMKAPDAGFYSALDADSEGVEGKYYTWTFEQWNKIMTNTDPYVSIYFGVKKEGNWEGTNILHVATRIEHICATNNLSEAQVMDVISTAKKALWQERENRVRPGTDDKCLLSWNALMNTSLTKASVAFECAEYLLESKRHLQWMLDNFIVDGALKHVWKNGTARIAANLDDYAYLIQALLQMASATSEEKWILCAVEFMDHIQQYFSERDVSLFYYTSSLENNIPLRKADTYDGVTPSSNAVMAECLSVLGMLADRSDWIAQSEHMLQQMRHPAQRHATSFAYWNILMQRLIKEFKTVIVTGFAAERTFASLQKKFAPECFYFFQKTENFVTMPFRKTIEEKTQIFICTKNSCFSPVENLSESIDFTIF